MSDPSVDDIVANVEFALPSESTRRRMSPLNLAILLSQQATGSPQYILIEHELNKRIARVQSRAAYWAAASASAGIVLGWFLNQMTPAAPVIVRCENNQATTQHQPKAPATNGGPPVPVITKEVQPSPQSSATQKNGSDAKK